MITNRTRLAFVAAMLVLAGCSSSDADQVTTTQPGSPEAITWATPEALVESLIAAIEAGDAATLEAVLPAESWDSFGAVLLDGFLPAPGDPPCPEVTESTARCYIFESDFPRVLEVAAESSRAGWIVARAVIESTN